MSTVINMLRRLRQFAFPSHDRTSCGAATDRSEGPDELSCDDLTVIRGIGTSTQDRLYRAGIKSFAQLAQASPESVREILGISARGAKVEAWIKEAAGLTSEK